MRGTGPAPRYRDSLRNLLPQAFAPARRQWVKKCASRLPYPTSFLLTRSAARRTDLALDGYETRSPGRVLGMPRVARVVIADVAHRVTQRGNGRQFSLAGNGPGNPFPSPGLNLTWEAGAVGASFSLNFNGQNVASQNAGLGQTTGSTQVPYPVPASNRNQEQQQ